MFIIFLKDLVEMKGYVELSHDEKIKRADDFDVKFSEVCAMIRKNDIEDKYKNYEDPYVIAELYMSYVCEIYKNFVQKDMLSIIIAVENMQSACDQGKEKEIIEKQKIDFIQSALSKRRSEIAFLFYSFITCLLGENDMEYMSRSADLSAAYNNMLNNQEKNARVILEGVLSSKLKERADLESQRVIVKQCN